MKKILYLCNITLEVYWNDDMLLYHKVTIVLLFRYERGSTRVQLSNPNHDYFYAQIMFFVHLFGTKL